MTFLAFEVREPISVSAAEPGWRALYVNPANNTEHIVGPVVAWAVHELRLEDADSGDQLPKVRRVIEGALASDDGGAERVPLQSGSTACGATSVRTTQSPPTGH